MRLRDSGWLEKHWTRMFSAETQMSLTFVWERGFDILLREKPRSFVSFFFFLRKPLLVLKKIFDAGINFEK